jgi:hypothetical protein
MTKTTRTAPPIPTAEPDDAGIGTTLDERTRHLCKLLEKEMLTGKLRLSFGDYTHLIPLIAFGGLLLLMCEW